MAHLFERHEVNMLSNNEIQILDPFVVPLERERRYVMADPRLDRIGHRQSPGRRQTP